MTKDCFDRMLLVFAVNEKQDEGHKVNMITYAECINIQFSLTDAEWKEEHKTEYTSYLDRDREAEAKIGSVFHPSATLNGRTFRGNYGDSN